MEASLKVENEELRLKILDLLDTLQQASSELYGLASSGREKQVHELAYDMREALHVILANSLELEKSDSRIKLSLAVESIEDSLIRALILFNGGYFERFDNKIEFELIPLLREAFSQFYFWGFMANKKNGVKEYLDNDRAYLYKNYYIDEAVETGKYKYEIAFVVLAYNKLEYTKLCIESLLKNIPSDCNYELILINHGSTDGTKEFFENINPTKLLDIKKNGGGMDACSRIVESQFVMQISNDVVITPGAIQNMLSCMKSDNKIAWVVPTTPNVSNLQTIEAEYTTIEQMMEFAKKNNQINPYRWEQRVRLCNPISLYRTETFLAEKGAGLNGYIHSVNVQSFPDDRVSLLLRRNGYKMILAKDAFCHHFGSVTLKDEIQQKEAEKFYLEGRHEFYRAFQIDPWETGFCYDVEFCNRVIDNELNHVDILGINCGMGSNSLKLKEQLKEFCHNKDVTLYNLTNDQRYLLDLKGISDIAQYISKIDEFNDFLYAKNFNYIVWEDPFLDQKMFLKLYEKVIKSLVHDGCLLMKTNVQNERWVEKNGQKIKPLGSIWNIIKK